MTVIVNASPEPEAGEMPDERLMAGMGAFNGELARAGIMVSGDGLKPSSHRARVRFAGADRLVVGGPFAETKELVAGCWVWEVPSTAEAVAWAKRRPNPMPGESEIAIRPFVTPEDFGEAFTPELQEQEDRLRQQVAARHGT